VWSNGNATHAREFLEQVLDDKHVDFMGLSEMEYLEGLPGQTFDGYKDYALIGATCNTSTPVGDPIGLYYNTKKWTLMDAYPPSQKCRRYPKVQYGSVEPPFICVPGKSTATEQGPDADCCSCTNPDGVAAQKPDGIYDKHGNPYPTQQDFQGSRPFALGTFRSTISRRMVCVVTFNLPHPLLANCTQSKTADCFGNADLSAFRPGTAHLVRTIQRFCKQMPLIFMGDTNNNAPEYETSFMFSNPEVPQAQDGCSSSQLDVLEDPVALVFGGSDDAGSPYTCCVDRDGNGTVSGLLLYASDRVAASGRRPWPSKNFFKPIGLYGGTSTADTEPQTENRLYPKECPGVNKPGYEPIQGFPCCGADEEHAPVMGRFLLFR